MRSTIIAFILFTICNSCIDDYNLKPKSNERRLVVEGTITNQNGPYYISLTKSRLELSFNPSFILSTNDITKRSFDGAERIIDAEVYVTDKNESVTETLIKSWTLFRHSQYPYDSIGYFGLYQTKKIIGIP